MKLITELAAPPTTSDTTPSGLPFVGELRWGDHFSQFYETAEDLRDCLVPYFRAGLENNEKCLWVTSEPLGVAAATAALRAAAPNLDALIACGQIEIIEHRDWYLHQADVAVGDLPGAWLARVEAALAAGYTGLRVTGNVAFLEASGWHDFMHYEATVHRCFKGQRIVALCSYPIGRCRFEQVLDVIRNHGFAIARRNGRWETIESASLAETKAELARLNRELEARVEDRTADLRAALAERRQAEERLRELLEAREQELADTRLLQDISTRLIQEGDIDALYRQVLDAAIGLMRSDMASMQMLDQDRGELQLLAWKGFHPESAAFWKWVHIHSGSTCGAALSTGQRIVVPDIEACDFISGTPDFDAFRRSGIRAVQSTPLVSRSGRLVGMISTHWREPHEPADRELRLFDILARQAADLIERAKAEAALRAGEERLRLALEAGQLGAWELDLKTDTAVRSLRHDQIFGYEQLLPEWGYEIFLRHVLPEDRAEVDRRLRMAIETCGEWQFACRIRRADGEVRWIEARGRPSHSEHGEVTRLLGIVADVTERRRAEEQQRWLTAELDHRVKNLLATVQSVAARTLPGDGATETFLGRITALARAHAVLAQNREGASLRALLEAELAPYRSKGAAHIRLEGDDVVLASTAVQTLGMVLHELATNAAKYGALSTPNGRLDVIWRIEPAPAGRRFVLTWAEHGGPPVEPPAGPGFGSRLIEFSVAHQLGGTAGFDFRKEGVRCVIDLPFTEEVGRLGAATEERPRADG